MRLQVFANSSNTNDLTPVQIVRGGIRDVPSLFIFLYLQNVCRYISVDAVLVVIKFRVAEIQ